MVGQVGLKTQDDNGVGRGDGPENPKFLISLGAQSASHGRKSGSTRGLGSLNRLGEERGALPLVADFICPFPFSRALEGPEAW